MLPHRRRIPHGVASAASRIVAMLAVTLALAAQERGQFPKAEDWLRRYLDSDRDGAADRLPRHLLDDAVRDLLSKEAAGLAWLKEQREVRDLAAPRQKAVDLLITNTVIEFLRQRRQSGITFAGQYEPLRALQPWSGDLLFGLLFDTPQWFPHTHRVRLVRPLRDLCAQPPSEVHVQRTVALVESSIEPEELRRALACMLWQWGTKQPAKDRLDALRRESGEGDSDDRIRILVSLAELQYELLDYRASATTYRSVQALASSAHAVLKPITLYASACSHALIGEVDRGIEALDQCATLLASPHLDSSLQLARSLWENDPEIASLRRDPRFAPIFARAFPTATPPAEPEKR